MTTLQLARILLPAWTTRAGEASLTSTDPWVDPCVQPLNSRCSVTYEVVREAVSIASTGPKSTIGLQGKDSPGCSGRPGPGLGGGDP